MFRRNQSSKGLWFSNFESREVFFRNEILIRTLVHKTSKSAGVAPTLDLPSLLRGCRSTRTCGLIQLHSAELSGLGLRDLSEVHRRGVPHVGPEPHARVTAPSSDRAAFFAPVNTPRALARCSI